MASGTKYPTAWTEEIMKELTAKYINIPALKAAIRARIATLYTGTDYVSDEILDTAIAFTYAEATLAITKLYDDAIVRA